MVTNGTHYFEFLSYVNHRLRDFPHGLAVTSVPPPFPRTDSPTVFDEGRSFRSKYDCSINVNSLTLKAVEILIKSGGTLLLRAVGAMGHVMIDYGSD